MNNDNQPQKNISPEIDNLETEIANVKRVFEKSDSRRKKVHLVNDQVHQWAMKVLNKTS